MGVQHDTPPWEQADVQVLLTTCAALHAGHEGEAVGDAQVE
jgi:hypothetical protein